MRGIKGARLATLVASLSLACCCERTHCADAAEAAEGPTNTSPPSDLRRRARRPASESRQGRRGAGQKPIAYSYAVVALRRRRRAPAPAIDIRQQSLLQGQPTKTSATRCRRRSPPANSEGQTAAKRASRATSSPPAAAGQAQTPGDLRFSPKDGQLLTVGNGTWKGTPPRVLRATSGSPAPRAASARTFAGATLGQLPRNDRRRSGANCALSSPPTNARQRSERLSIKTEQADRTAGRPVSIGAPTIAGSLQEGQTLTAAHRRMGGHGAQSPSHTSGCAARSAAAAAKKSRVPPPRHTHSASPIWQATSPSSSPRQQRPGQLPTATSAETQADARHPAHQHRPAEHLRRAPGRRPAQRRHAAAGAAQNRSPTNTSGSCATPSARPAKTSKARPARRSNSTPARSARRSPSSSQRRTPQARPPRRAQSPSLIAGILPKNTALPSDLRRAAGRSACSASPSGSWSGSEPISYDIPVAAVQRPRPGLRKPQRRDRLHAQTRPQRDRQDPRRRRHSDQCRRLDLGDQLCHRPDRRHPAEKHRAAEHLRRAPGRQPAQRRQRQLERLRTDLLRIPVAAVQRPRPGL